MKCSERTTGAPGLGLGLGFGLTLAVVLVLALVLVLVLAVVVAAYLLPSANEVDMKGSSNGLIDDEDEDDDESTAPGDQGGKTGGWVGSGVRLE